MTTDREDKKLEETLKELSKDSTHIVLSPKTLEELKAKGVKFEEKFIKYEDYFEDLVNQKRKNAVTLLQQLPLLDSTIANAVISTIYGEIRASFALEIFTSTIFNSIVMLEFAMRIRIFNERLKVNSNAKWEDVEKQNMKRLAGELRKLKIITKKQRIMLDSFNDDFRNPYLHINIHKMIKGIYANRLRTINTKDGQTKTENEVDVTKHPHLWFMAKKLYDKTYVMQVLQFCVGWTNDLLKR